MGSLCLYCGQMGYFLSSKSPGSSVRDEVLVSHTSKPSSNLRPLCPARLLLPQGFQTLTALIDLNIMDDDLARQLGVDLVLLPCPVPVKALDGCLMKTVTHQMVPIRMLPSGNHHETVQFHMQSLHHPLLLGFPWLRRHNPHLDCTTGAILGWSSSCHQVCLNKILIFSRSRDEHVHQVQAVLQRLLGNSLFIKAEK